MTLYEGLVRLDFLVTLLLLGIVPLGLLLVSLFLPPIRSRLLVYWRAALLLVITIYLWIGETGMGFATGVAARALIPLALWRGDAFHVLRDQPVPSIQDARAFIFRYWRTATIAYSVVGLVYMLPLLSCVRNEDGAMCQPWYDLPQPVAEWLHPNIEPLWLARYGWVALGIYAAYLLSTAVRLQRDLLERRAQ